MDGGERNDGGGGEPEVEDEFACVGLLRESLASLHGAVERIFGVAFDIGGGDLTPAYNGQIWLKLQGLSSSVRAAKVSCGFLCLTTLRPCVPNFHISGVAVASSFRLEALWR